MIKIYQKCINCLLNSLCPQKVKMVFFPPQHLLINKITHFPPISNENRGKFHHLLSSLNRDDNTGESN